MSQKYDETPPFVGKPAKKRLRELDDLSAAQSDLDLHILRLLALHPALKERFANQDLASLDDAAKQALLNDMNRTLGVRPLKKPKPAAKKPNPARNKISGAGRKSLAPGWGKKSAKAL